jgi:hypothetical protein
VVVAVGHQLSQEVAVEEEVHLVDVVFVLHLKYW